MSAPTPKEIEAAIVTLVEARGSGKTICPSEVARALGGPHPDGWGPLMKPVRAAAVRLAHQGRLSILRKGRAVDPDDFRGVYRLSTPVGAGADQERGGGGETGEDEAGEGPGSSSSV